MLLAQHGARVTKVEPPEGDWIARHGHAPRRRDRAVDLAANRGKREPRRST
jgi:crotonobetainyl-CoA:carnitine CoA-transferase CaiB-like acyl-CoA transferase